MIGKAREQNVEVSLRVRLDKTWVWRVSLLSKHPNMSGKLWSHSQIENDVDNIGKAVSLAGGALAEHQNTTLLDTHDPSEISRLASECYRDLCAALEKRHGGSVPKLGISGLPQ